MVAHTCGIDYDSVLDSALRAAREVNTYKFMGIVDSVMSLYSKDPEGRCGEIFYAPDTDEVCVCDGTTWNPISRSSNIGVPEVIRHDTRIVSCCPRCGGAITHITPKGRSEGYQQCEWCMSIINIYED